VMVVSKHFLSSVNPYQHGICRLDPDPASECGRGFGFSRIKN
jgi:hypothetical protein